MDLVSFESPDEYRHFAKIMFKGILGRCLPECRLTVCCCPDNITAMWTSGRKCNFLNKGCDSAELQPVNFNGWFWADGNKRIPSTTVPSKLTFWSGTGETGQRQPDNYQGKKEGSLENFRVS